MQIFFPQPLHFFIPPWKKSFCELLYFGRHLYLLITLLIVVYEPHECTSHQNNAVNVLYNGRKLTATYFLMLLWIISYRPDEELLIACKGNALYLSVGKEVIYLLILKLYLLLFVTMAQQSSICLLQNKSLKCILQLNSVF